MRLIDLYRAVHSVKTSINQENFFDYIIPDEKNSDLAKETKEKYIRDDSKMPKKIKNYYKDKDNELKIKNHLKKWDNFIHENKEAILNVIFESMKEHDDEKTACLLKKEYNLQKREDIFYIIFKYSLCNELDMESENVENSNQNALQDFVKILQEYGISSRTGRTVIIKLAKSGSDNPYILFEAAEIEYMRSYDAKGTDIKDSLENAYTFYEKASKKGHALACWSLGYLAEQCRQKPWHIKAFDNMSDKEKLSTAMQYFKRAASNGCSKAYNSLGNYAATLKGDELSQLSLSAKQCYKEAADRNNFFGMYNYARELEKELKQQVENREYNALKKRKVMITKGEEMMDYYQRASNLGYPKANYRCGLYYGHLLDDSTAMNNEFYIVEQNNTMAIKYLEMAVQSSEYSPCYDAYIYLSEYMLKNAELFFAADELLQKVKCYIDILEKELLNTNRISGRQKDKINELKQLLASRK